MVPNDPSPAPDGSVPRHPAAPPAGRPEAPAPGEPDALAAARAVDVTAPGAANVVSERRSTDRMRQTLAWAAVAVLLGAIVVKLGPALSPLITALVVSYMVAPVADRLHRLRLPRAAAAGVAVLLAVAALASLLLLLVPVVETEVALLRKALPQVAANITATVSPWLERVAGVRIGASADAMRDWITRQLSEGGSDLVTTVLSYAGSGWVAALEIASYVLLVPILMFYLLVDWHRIRPALMAMVPFRWRPGVMHASDELDERLGGWLRGVVLVGAAMATFYALGLLLAGFELWLSIGVLTGILMFIPYIGFAIGLAFALVAGMLQFGLLDGLVRVAIVYSLGQAIESWWLTPKLVGERVGLHPVTVIASLLAFGAVLGFAGVLLALPLAATASVVLERVRAHWTASEFFRRKA